MIATIEFIALVLCSIAGGVLATYWGAVGFHVVRTMVMIPTARRGLALAAERGKKPWPRVCVVVPAHNEEASIGLVADSLAKQDYPALTAVFSLDRCTDRTGDRLRAVIGDKDHFEIVHISECPPEWSGKTNAIWRAVQDSHVARTADLYLFIDADTVLHPACVRACVALLESRGLGMLSLLSTLTADRWFEKIVQPAAGMELIRQYPIFRANASPESGNGRPFANGQFILITRAAYEAVGGHDAVHDALLEDIQIARELHARKIPAGMFMADRLLHCRMYGSWAEFTRGWKRIYIESANRKPARLRSHGLRVRVLGLDLPMLALLGIAGGLAFPGLGMAAGVALWLCAAGLALFMLVIGACYAISSTPVRYAPLYPLGAWNVWRIMQEAAADTERGVKTVWGGREYVLKAR